MNKDSVPAGMVVNALGILKQQQRQAQKPFSRFGQVRPPISTLWQGQRVVAVGNRLYHSNKWKFFADFLRDYVPEVLGLEWCKAESEKPQIKRHPVIGWRTDAAIYMNAQPAQADGSRAAIPSGAVSAYFCLAYDLYIVDQCGGIDEEFLQRFKDIRLFQGARHELFAEATCYRAGFTIEHENEKDRTRRHAEFTARHVATGQILSVEAKSRHRRGVLGVPGDPEKKPDFRLGELINGAVAKNPIHPLVIFVDANMPFKWADRVLGRLADGLSRPMKELLDRIQKHHGGSDPYSMLVFSNHPHHYAIHGPDPQRHLLSVWAQHPNADVFALKSLHDAADLYGNIPVGFETDRGTPPQTLEPSPWPKVRYDLRVDGTEVSVLREGELTASVFWTTESDIQQAPSQLHEFLEDIGLSPVDAKMICMHIEKGSSVSNVFGLK